MSDSERSTDRAGPDVRPDPGPPPPAPHHPEVRHEHSDVNVRAILWVAAGLVATAVVIHLVVWWLFDYYQRRDARANAGVPSLVAEEGSRPLGERLRDLPGPRLEGLEAEFSRLVLRTEGEEELTFDVPRIVLVERDGKEITPKGKQFTLFDLAEGMRVRVTYRMDNGRGVAIAIEAPPGESSERGPKGADLQQAVGRVAKIEPVDVAARRAWGEARLSRYGWVDEKDKVAHIPIDSAMQAILSKELRKKYLPAAKTEEGAGRGGKGRSETGRGTRGEKR